jgi:cell division protease FtsH
LGRILRSGGLLYFIILMVFAVILVRVLSAGNPDVKELNSQQFKQAVEDKAFVTNLSETDPNTLTVKDEDQTVTGLLKEENGQGQEFEYSYPEYYDIADVFNDANIPFTTDPQNTGFWLTLLGTLGPILLIILFFILFMSSMQGGGNRVMSFGKSRARRMTKDQPKVTFADVAGADEAVQELTEIKEFLEAPQKFQKLGARIPKGALLAFLLHLWL